MSGDYKRRSKTPIPLRIGSAYEIGPCGHSAPEVDPHGRSLLEGCLLDEAAAGRQDVYLPASGRTGVDDNKIGGGVGVDPYACGISVYTYLSYRRV